MSETFISWVVTESDYSGDASHEESYLTGELVETSITLPSGAEYEFNSPEFVHKWDNGDELRVTMSDELLNHYDSDEREFVDVETDDGETATFGGAIIVENVPDTDLGSETVGILYDWADMLDEIESGADDVKASYDVDLIDILFDALDDGLIDPSDLRGIEGLAEHLSGSTDATESRYQMALLSTLGLERADLEDVASMTLDYDGYTDITVSRENFGVMSSIVDRDETEIEGQLFTETGPDTTLSTGSKYLTNPLIAGRVDGEFQLTTLTNTWTPLRDPDLTPRAASVHPDLEAVAVTDSSGAFVYDFESGEKEQLTSEGCADIAFSPNGQYVAVSFTESGHDEHEGIKVYDFEDDLNTTASYEGDNSEGEALAWGDNKHVFQTATDTASLSSSDETSIFFVHAEDGIQWTREAYGDYNTGENSPRGIAATGKHERLYYGETGEVELAAWDYDGDRLDDFESDLEPDGFVLSEDETELICLKDNTLIHIDGETGEELEEVSIDVEAELVNIVDTVRNEAVLANAEEEGLFLVDILDGSTTKVADTVVENYYFEEGFAVESEDWVDGVLYRPTAFDAPSGDTIDLRHGVVEITEMTDRDGDVLDDDYEADWDRPQYDTYDPSEFQEYLDRVAEEHEEALADDDDGMGGIGAGDDDSDAILYGLIALGAAFLAAIGLGGD
ncbi:hypothetical protein [Natronobacterium gregoryi]|uniref:hypothetical protein n=1 Tax=Natronobacterium gregoryi TaxID=44930 RepID=UPI0020C907F8|nr:hypothetical protein [Natronobacterium gregoryi]